jgi:hypothetical protein
MLLHSESSSVGLHLSDPEIGFISADIVSGHFLAHASSHLLCCVL